MSNSPTLPPAAGSLRKPTPFPALAAESDARVQAALAASARAEASLSSLFRALQQLGTGVDGAREANESLAVELEGLRELLGVESHRQQVFERKIAELEVVLDRTRTEHAQERTFLIDQQDLFLVKLLDEQELELKRRDAELETLRARLSGFEHRERVALAPTLVQPSAPPAPMQSAPPDRSALEREERAELERTAQKLAEDRERARETVARLQLQRDEAQNAVLRISNERDEAIYEIHRLRSELGGPRIPLSTRPPADELRRESSALPPARREVEARDAQDFPAISSVLSPPPGDLHALLVPSRLSPPPSRPGPAPSAASASQPPEELRRALTGPSPPKMSAQPPPDSRSPLKQKPDASTRPLVGYSLGTGSVAPERLDAAALRSSNPPGSHKR
jgi:hypothetical protein